MLTGTLPTLFPVRCCVGSSVHSSHKWHVRCCVVYLLSIVFCIGMLDRVSMYFSEPYLREIAKRTYVGVFYAAVALCLGSNGMMVDHRLSRIGLHGIHYTTSSVGRSGSATTNCLHNVGSPFDQVRPFQQVNVSRNAAGVNNIRVVTQNV